MSDLISRSEAVQRLIQETVDSKNNLIHINTVKRLLQDVDTSYDIDKVVEELEKIRAKETCNKEKCDTKELCRICVVDDAIEIVKQEAEKCKSIYMDGEYCWQSCWCTDRCGECNRLCNGDIDYYESYDARNNGWITCSERLPKYGEVVMCSCTNSGITISCITHKGVKPSKSVRFGQHSVIAWQPLPQPYQPKGE